MTMTADRVTIPLPIPPIQTLTAPDATVFEDRRYRRPKQGLELASCLKCRAQRPAWEHYMGSTDLRCTCCGRTLATWYPPTA